MTRPEPGGDESLAASFEWDADQVARDACAGYDVRLGPVAWQAMDASIESSRRRRGPHVETGGLLFGERDDAAQLLWITDASGPPPDSRASRYGFECGIQGTAALNVAKRTQSHGSVQFVGTWHTHPEAAPLPSQIDLAGMAQIVTSVDPPINKALLVIVGHTPRHASIGAYLFRRQDFVVVRQPMAAVTRRSGLWWRLLELFGRLGERRLSVVSTQRRKPKVTDHRRGTSRPRP